MVTWKQKIYMGDGRYLCIGDCKSGDTKPARIEEGQFYNGSRLEEMGTNKTWKYEQSSESWVEWSGGSGGSDYPAAEGEEF